MFKLRLPPINEDSYQFKQVFLRPYQILLFVTTAIYIYFFHLFGFHSTALGVLFWLSMMTISGLLSYFKIINLTYRQEANLNIGIYLGSLFTICNTTGGLSSPAGWWIPSVALLSIILLELHDVIIWSVISITASILLIILENIYPIKYMGDLHKMPHQFTLYSALVIVVLAGLLVVISEYLQEKKRAELREMKREMEHQIILSELGNVSAGIAHEINNPLQIIQGYIGVLNRQDNIENIRPILEKISKQIFRTSKIVKNLKQLSRDGHSDKLIKLNLREKLAELREFYLNQFNNLNISLQIEVNQTISIQFREVQFFQVMSNLLNNAKDYLKENIPTDKRWIKIIVTSSDSDTCIIQVQNAGDKIPPKIAAKIFTPFFTTKDVNKGTGLGLSLTKSIVEQNGGKIVLEPNAPYTTFTITLRRSAAE
jgi:signal transduction histidine kinase